MKREINHRPTFCQPQHKEKKFFIMLMGHQIIEVRMICTVNLFFSFKADKNIRKLIILFSSLCVDFELWCDFFAGNIVLWARSNLFEFGCYSQLFSKYGTSHNVLLASLCNFMMCILGKYSARMFFNECVPKIFQ